VLQKSEAALGKAGHDDLAQRALDVLEANWRGASTVPSPRLYPHQWSWDSACIAIGYSRSRAERAEQELRSLFRGQWQSGLLPHIVFAEGQGYFPGPEFWRTDVAPDAPREPRTSGIVQPPVHATAVLQVYLAARDRDGAEAFAALMRPKLEAWHDYLYRERNRDGDGLIEIWHPWESGMDNSPLWDPVLERIELTQDEVPEYERIDRTVVDPAGRPTDQEYDYYAYLVKLFRERGYDGDAIRADCPFVVQDVLFNSLLVQANRDLAELAERTGGERERHLRRAEQTAAAIEERLWNEQERGYFDRDVRAGRWVPVRAGSAFAPLYAGAPSRERAGLLAAMLADFGVALPHGGRAVPSLGVDDPKFEPVRYWRGPVWPMVNWVVHRGLRRYGYDDEAAQLRSGILTLAGREGFWEHYNPLTGGGQGGEQFAWTAALILDLLAAHDAET
jgi:glycogen debranching enzyme